MKVYRVEHVSGHGPYQSLQMSDDVFFVYEKHKREIMDLDGRHPMPYNDGIYYAGGLHFGFRNRRQLKSWFFAPVRRVFGKVGFVVRLYDVPEDFVKIGEKQVAFNKDKAELIGECPLDSF